MAMEPSRPANIDSIKNFAVSVEDFILHFCASEYLCKGESTYHITDLSKGAMRVTDASSSPALRYERYKRWYPLLCEEIELVARPNAPIIPVGYMVRDFLCVQKTLRLEDEILHYSQSAASHRPKMKRCYPDRYAKFKDTVDMSHIEATVKRVMEGAELGPGEPEKTLKRLQKRQETHEIQETTDVYLQMPVREDSLGCGSLVQGLRSRREQVSRFGNIRGNCDGLYW